MYYEVHWIENVKNAVQWRTRVHTAMSIGVQRLTERTTKPYAYVTAWRNLFQSDIESYLQLM